MLSFELGNSKTDAFQQACEWSPKGVFLFEIWSTNGELLVWGPVVWDSNRGYNQVTNPSHKGDSRTLKPPIWEVHFMQVSTCPAYEKTAGKLRTFPIGKKESAGNKWLKPFHAIWGLCFGWFLEGSSRKLRGKVTLDSLRRSPIPQTWQHARCIDT